MIMIKLFINKKIVIYRSASLDVEPLYTFRSHTGPVFCLAISKNGEHCFSGGLDNMIKVWSMPSANIDPYDSYGNLIFIVYNTTVLEIILIYLLRIQIKIF